MFARTQKIATSRLAQFINQVGLQTRTMATVNTKLPLNTGAKIREHHPAMIKSNRVDN